MIVYRLSRTKYANDLSGEGARLHGGRWNRIGIPCIYTGASRALSLLEYTVNIGIDEIPRALSFVSYQIPDDDILFVPITDLPGNWTSKPTSDDAKNFGSSLLNSSQHLIIQVPSVIIPEEFNYLINPLHSGAGKIRIIEVADFAYDVRIKHL